MSQLSSATGGYEPRHPAVSSESRRIVESMMESQRHYYCAPVSRQPVLARDGFQALVSKWREATQYMSSVTQMICRPEYLRIIGMGEAVLPDILRELEREPDQWGPALTAITGDDPVREEDWGDVQAMATAWLDWGRARGIVW